MKPPRLSSNEKIGLVKQDLERQKEAESRWDSDVSNSEKLGILKKFLTEEGVSLKILKNAKSLSQVFSSIQDLPSLAQSKVIDAAIANLNNPSFDHIRTQLGRIINISKRDEQRFLAFADAYQAYGNDKSWPSHKLTAQYLLGGYLSKIAPLNSEQVFQRYRELTLDESLKGVNADLIHGLTQFKKQMPEVKNLCKKLLQKDIVRPTVYVIAKLNLMTFLPTLETMKSDLDQSGRTDSGARLMYSALSSAIKKLNG